LLLNVALQHFASHPGTTHVEGMIPNQDSQPLADAVIDCGYELKTPSIN
jgi:hypothetical protein